jgi:hypothetical protein
MLKDVVVDQEAHIGLKPRFGCFEKHVILYLESIGEIRMGAIKACE